MPLVSHIFFHSCVDEFIYKRKHIFEVLIIMCCDGKYYFNIWICFVLYVIYNTTDDFMEQIGPLELL